MQNIYETTRDDIEEYYASMGLSARPRTESEKDIDACYAEMRRRADPSLADMPCELDVKHISGVSCYEKDGTAYLRLEDVARGLGFTEEHVGKKYIRWMTVEKYLRDIGFSQKVEKNTYIPENIFYRLAMKAKNETAERFQALVADEIIPSIRRQGVYISPEVGLDPDTVMLLCRQLKAAQTERDTLADAARKNTARIAELAPKGAFADAVSASSRSILVGELAKILCQNGVDIGQNRLFDWMRDHGYLIRDPKRSDYNMPTQKSMEMGLFDIKETAVIHSDGRRTISTTPKVTGKGQLYFVDYFLSGKAGPVTLPPRSRAARKKKGSAS